MIDRYALRLLSHLNGKAARLLHAWGVTADQMTFLGFGLGFLAAALVALGETTLAIVPLLLSRACDGIDGPLARLHSATDRGAFLDISFDFTFYAAIPLAFAIADAPANGLAAAILLAAFLGTGTSFLAYAAIAEKRGLKSPAYPSKSIYYLGGLTEGTETIACFLAMCWWPEYFAVIAYIFASLCLITTAMRIFAGWHAFGPRKN